MPVTLNNKNLLDYFSGMPKENIIAFLTQQKSFKELLFDTFNPHYFKNNGADHLLVTLGDSWTWGTECSGYEDFYEFQEADWKINNRIISNINKNRLTQTYGAIISDTINSDWLNLGVPGCGNIQIADLVKQLGNIIPNLEYKKITVICTFTEVGRWFNTEFDLTVDHSQLMQSMDKSKTVDFFLAELNRISIARIISSLDAFPQVRLLVGSNFVDQIGFDQLNKDQRLLTPWYQLLNISYDYPMYVVYSLAIANFVRSIDDGVIPKSLHSIFKSWIVDALEKEKKYAQINASCRYYLPNGNHPLFEGQKIWADYILTHIIQ